MPEEWQLSKATFWNLTYLEQESGKKTVDILATLKLSTETSDY